MPRISPFWDAYPVSADTNSGGSTVTIAHRLPLTYLSLALLGLFLVTGSGSGADRLTSRPHLRQPEVKPLPVGEEVRTTGGQKRRILLPDGSVVFVNEQTTFTLTASRSLNLTAGEVLLEAAAGKDRFVITTPKREIRAMGTSFAVRATDKGTAVLVTRGKVEIINPDGKALTLNAGQRLTQDGEKPEPSPRTSHVLDWTRDLMIAAEAPLVPVSAYNGGSLTVVDPNGQEAKLSLRKYHIDVFIEDGFARTTIDQTYFNDTHGRLEGTFHFPLPPDASLSRLAMYVDGTRMEGGMIERDHGRNVYESIVSKQQDPALLEWIDGSTFKMRVFPLEPRQEKRIVLSYSQRLQSLYGQESYRFPAGHSLANVRDWSLFVRVKNGKGLTWSSPSHPLRQRDEGNDSLLEAGAKNVKLDRDFVLNLASAGGGEETRFSTMEHEGSKYLMVRHRLALNQFAEPLRKPRDLVILFESSGDRDPLLARTQVEVVRGLLQNAEPDDTFIVLTAGTRTRVLKPERQPVTPENVKQALTFLEDAHLIGALDLGRALTGAAELLKEGRSPHLIHVGSGIAAMGEQRQDALVKRIPKGVRYVGIGVGRRWNRALMKEAGEWSGGLFTQINPDEPIGWRCFELASTLNSPRLLSVIAREKEARNRWLSFSTLGTQGEEFCAVTRLATKELPETIQIMGLRDGELVGIDVTVPKVIKEAAHLPRTWAKLEIDRLLAEDAAKHKKEIIALSKSMVVMSPFTSLLVLENEAMYQQYKVDRGRKDHWALYDCPEKIEVFAEDEDGNRIDPKWPRNRRRSRCWRQS